MKYLTKNSGSIGGISFQEANIATEAEAELLNLKGIKLLDIRKTNLDKRIVDVLETNNMRLILKGNDKFDRLFSRTIKELSRK